MDEHDIKFRHCSRCPYIELRGSRQGAFIDGKFVCSSCYVDEEIRRAGTDGQSSGT